MLGGALPSALGDISSQLEVAKLELNRLSCDVPESVLNWDKNPNMTAKEDLSLLSGNLLSEQLMVMNKFSAITGVVISMAIRRGWEEGYWE